MTSGQFHAHKCSSFLPKWQFIYENRQNVNLTHKCILHPFVLFKRADTGECVAPHTQLAHGIPWTRFTNLRMLSGKKDRLWHCNFIFGRSTVIATWNILSLPRPISNPEHAEWLAQIWFVNYTDCGCCYIAAGIQGLYRKCKADGKQFVLLRAIICS